MGGMAGRIRGRRGDDGDGGRPGPVLVSVSVITGICRRPATPIRSDLAPNSIRAQQGLLLDASTVGLGCVPCFKSDPPISIVCVSFRRSNAFSLGTWIATLTQLSCYCTLLATVC